MTAMTINNRTNSKYSENILRYELGTVFGSVYFADKKEKEILEDSYYGNFKQMMRYARDNGIDEKEYIRAIRSVLLSCPRVYDLTR